MFYPIGGFCTINKYIMRRRFNDTQLKLYDEIIIDQSITNPLQRVSGDINGPIIQYLRQNSHRYLCKYYNGSLHVLALNDTNTGFVNSMAVDLTGPQGDVMMKPPKFYTLFTDLSGNLDRVSIKFALEPQGLGNWMEWFANDMIGVYEAAFLNNYIRSISGMASSGGVTYETLYAHSHSRTSDRSLGPGYGFTLVKQRHQNIMGILYVAMYGNTDCQGTIGYGTDDYRKINGGTNALGMEDTNFSTNGNDQSINFWGLENWWGNKYEWVDNVVVNPYAIDSIFRITEDNGINRDVQSTLSRGSLVYPHKMILGDNLDLIANYGESGGASGAGWSDSQNIGSATSRVVQRSGYNDENDGGIAYSNAGFASSYSSITTGSRLCYTGPITEVEDYNEFSQIPLIL